MRRFVMVLFLFALSTPALAHRRPAPHGHAPVRVAVAPFGVHVELGPWSIGWTPAPRPGWVWVAGAHHRGRWVPGHWVPAGPPPRSGLVFVVGHWDGDAYVDGYWRDETHEGQVWQDGYYDEYGDWVEGRWVPEDEADVPVIYVEDPTEPGDEPSATERSLALPAGAEQGDLHSAPPLE